MKRLTIPFAVVMFMFGCTALPKYYIPVGHNFTNSSSNLSCQDLYEDIARKWGYHQNFKTCYYYNEKLISSIIQKQDCFIGSNEDMIVQFFGEPTIVANGRYKFNLSKECTEIDTVFSMHSLYFEFSDSKVEKVYYIKASTIN